MFDVIKSQRPLEYMNAVTIICCFLNGFEEDIILQTVTAIFVFILLATKCYQLDFVHFKIKPFFFLQQSFSPCSGILFIRCFSIPTSAGLSLLIFQRWGCRGVFWMGWESAVRWAFTLNEMKKFVFPLTEDGKHPRLSSTCSQRGTRQVMVEVYCCFLWAFLLLAAPFIFSLVSQQESLWGKHTLLLLSPVPSWPKQSVCVLRTNSTNKRELCSRHACPWTRFTSANIHWLVGISLLKHSLWNSANRDFFFGWSLVSAAVTRGISSSWTFTNKWGKQGGDALAGRRWWEETERRGERLEVRTDDRRWSFTLILRKSLWCEQRSPKSQRRVDQRKCVL